MPLKVTNLKIAYKGIQAVHGVDFQAEDGKITVIIGSNGVGKTSILKGIMGIVKPTAGEIEYNGVDLLKLSSSKRTSIGLSLCPEGRQLFPNMTVQENLELGAYARSDKGVKSDLHDIFHKFPRLSERRSQKAGTLSGGEQELVAIARALMAKPKLLILDEPSWGLAPIMIDEVVSIIKDINAQGTTILLIEQNANIALRMADYAYVMDVSGIVAEGTGQQLLNDEKVREVYMGA
ncbi:ABC transporter ATP-binding protein [Paenibacillus chungangensis]|uniref:ABC transporter ATP-binding protein n=1 Tax=Paenibacillus chungangensis TaxID=696535 RepID=A0ABW3HQR5_9BACL